MQFELAAIYQHAPVGLAVFDAQLRFVDINERMAEMNGAPVAAHLGRTVMEVLPALADLAQSALRQVLATGEAVVDLEVRGATPARPGVERVWREHITPLRDQAGAVVGLSVVAQEVTEWHRMQAQLQRSEQRLALALDSADLVPWEWHVREDRIDVGPREWLGYPPSQFPTTLKALQAAMHPDDFPHLRACLTAHLEGRAANYECEYRMRAADGRWHWVSTLGKITRRDADGRPLVLTGVRRDITAHKQAQMDVLEQSQLLQLAFDAIVVWSAAHGIERWNQGAEAQYGYTAEEALGRMPAELLDTRFDQPFEAVLRTLSDQGVWRGEVSHRRKDGRRIRVELLMQRVGERVDRVLEIMRDVTREREATARLAQSEQALLEAQERRDEFLAMLGHELRNPLAPITNVVRLLEVTGNHPDKRAASLDILRRQTQHLTRLVDDLLEVTRITQGRIELRKERVLLLDAVAAAIETARPLAREKAQRLDVEVPSGLSLHADPVRLTQVISNLVVNAVKYTPEGGHIAVDARPVDGGWIELSVQDDGAGIPQELQPRIFELFTQDPRTRHRSQGGLGIGLALARQLAELHGGTIRCESEGAGRGARFTVSLPGEAPSGDGRSLTSAPAHNSAPAAGSAPRH